jgi:NAD(P)-dependent dehydrogenase (short-subunit alcohol dehydrogenase family)
MNRRRGAFYFSQAVLPLLLDNVQDSQYPPTLIFTSATAASKFSSMRDPRPRLTLGTVKGSAMCSSFAAGKFAMRATAQSLAREFGPKGIHVVHAIIDGVIDIERTKHWTFEHEDAKIKPESVSDLSGSENRGRVVIHVLT